MSDFDTVLERLLVDPAFASALAADPARTLAGYRLTQEEAALLRSQVTGDTGGQSAVETRANQSSTFGLLTPLAGLAGATDLFGHADAAQQGLGRAPAHEQGLGAATGGRGGGQGAAQVAAAQGFGTAPAAAEGFGTAPAAAEGFGAAPAATEGFGTAPAAAEGFGTAGRGTWEEAQPPTATAAWASADGSTATGTWDTAEPPTGRGSLEPVRPAGDAPPPPEGYRTRVDVDGDGRWDRHTLRGTPDGGVDILVDANGDGAVDFVGHDTDADGLVDSAEYDRNRDGFFERRSYDDDGDGWLDRHETRRPPAPPP